MNAPLLARRGTVAAFAASAVALIFLVGIAPGSANADVTTGNASISISSGQAGYVSAIKPAKVAKRIGKKGARVNGSVSDGMFGDGAAAAIAGGIRFANGKRKVTVVGMRAFVAGKKTTIEGSLGGKTMTVFNAFGAATVDEATGKAKLSGGKLYLTRNAASTIRKSLKLRKAPKGRIGGLFVNVNTTYTDQYNELCGVGVASRAIDSWPAAAELPALSGSTLITAPTSVNWGFKASFRGYVYGTMSAGGKDSQALQPLDGASRTMPPFDPTRGFSFPVSGGEHASNGPGLSDDQAVINGTGTALFCNSEHGFWASISDPTIVIDGENSRIVATVSQNINGNGMFGDVGPWQTRQRVDLADLDVGAVTPTESEAGITYTEIPVTLSNTVAPFATYPGGQLLDPVSVTVKG